MREGQNKIRPASVRSCDVLKIAGCVFLDLEKNAGKASLYRAYEPPCDIVTIDPFIFPTQKAETV